jgi:hypothetical protein
MRKICSSFLATTIILASLGLLVALGSDLAATPASFQAPAPLPSAREIIDKFVRAIGGRSAILKHKSSYAKAHYEMPGQMSAEMEVFSAAPNKLLVKISIPGAGDIKTGFDGKVGWDLNPMAGASLHKGKRLEQTRRQADFYGDLHEEKNFQSIETVGLEDFEGTKCYKLRLTTSSGDTYLEFFDAKSFLLVGRVGTAETGAGPAEVRSVVADYKKFGDLLVPGKSTSKGVIAGQAFEEIITVTTIQYDSVDPAVFELPDQIKELLGSQAP